MSVGCADRILNKIEVNPESYRTFLPKRCHLALLTGRKTLPSEIFAAAIHESILTLTAAGTVTVRRRFPCPTRSGRTQRSRAAGCGRFRGRRAPRGAAHISGRKIADNRCSTIREWPRGRVCAGGVPRLYFAYESKISVSTDRKSVAVA